MWQQPKLDLHQFVHRPMMVSKDTDLAFSDIGRMHLERRKPTARRLPIPNWAHNTEETRELILKFVESALYLRNNSGSYDERLARIAEVSKTRADTVAKELERHTKVYAALCEEGHTPEPTLNRLRIVIQNRDSLLCALRRPGGLPFLVAAVIHYSYRMHWNSTTVAEELGVHPPYVRIVLYRLNRMFSGKAKSQHFPDSPRATRLTSEQLRQLFVMRESGMSLIACARALHVCQHKCYRAWKTVFGELHVSLKKPKVELAVKMPEVEKRLATPRRSKVWTPERLRELFLLYMSGHTQMQCAKHFGTSGPYVSILCRKYFGERSVKPAA